MKNQYPECEKMEAVKDESQKKVEKERLQMLKEIRGKNG